MSKTPLAIYEEGFDAGVGAALQAVKHYLDAMEAEEAKLLAQILRSVKAQSSEDFIQNIQNNGD